MGQKRLNSGSAERGDRRKQEEEEKGKRSETTPPNRKQSSRNFRQHRKGSQAHLGSAGSVVLVRGRSGNVITKSSTEGR